MGAFSRPLPGGAGHPAPEVSAALVPGFPWLTHSPRPGCASAQAGAVCEGVWVARAAHTKGVPGTGGVGAGGRGQFPPRSPQASLLPHGTPPAPPHLTPHLHHA